MKAGDSMSLMFVALRSAVFASGFLWLWAWVAMSLRLYDAALGGLLPLWTRAAGGLALACGAAVVAWCLGAFVLDGRGTPALFDPPRKLVARGPYRYSRNPMYIGAALLLLGFGMYQRSPSIVAFVPVWWLLFHLLVVFYEEAALRGKFGLITWSIACVRRAGFDTHKGAWTGWTSSQPAIQTLLRRCSGNIKARFTDGSFAWCGIRGWRKN
jgi:protein-S-isoprenylcysteine O-methyltransferase Ste14